MLLTMSLTQLCLKRILKASFLILLFSIIRATYFIFYSDNESESELKYYFPYYVTLSEIDPRDTPEKIIFLWTPIQDSYKEWSWGIGPDPVISDCGNARIDGRCLITTHPSLLEKSDVVLFSVQDIKQRIQNSSESRNSVEVAPDAFPQLAPEIRRKQLWLLVWYESNIMLNDFFDTKITDDYVASFDGIFNGTLSYRNDSFITHNFYGQSCNYKKVSNTQIEGSEWEKTKDSAMSKSSLVTWFVSHCDTPSKREKYVDEMKKIIPVDIFGKCSENNTSNIVRDSTEEKELLSQYKFYLAFENSRCPEYVTEKLYKIVNSKTADNPPVPIVMGPKKSWYEQHLPRKSFIHVDDFDNPEKLASYLMHLNSNPESYLNYLNWRQNYRLVCEPKVRCKLCDFLLNSNHESTPRDSRKIEKSLIISDFKSFWQKAKCFN